MLSAPRFRRDAVVYLISYDGQSTPDDKVAKYIERAYPARARVLFAQYLVRSDATALAILLDLTKHTEPTSRLLVSEVTQNLASQNLQVDEATMETWEAQAHDCAES